MVQLPNGSRLTRSARSRTGPLGTSRTSVRRVLSLFSFPRSTQQRRLTQNLNSERTACLGDAPDPGGPRRISGPSRDNRASPRPNRRRRRILSILHADPHRWVADRHPQSNRLLPGRIQRQRPGYLRPERVFQPGLRISRSARVQPRLARGHDWPNVIWSARVVSV